MAVEVEIDVEVLKCEIKKTYAKVSQEPGEDFIFPTGRAWALDLGYPPELLARLPEGAAESFAGVANPFVLGTLERGEAVLDVGSGAGTDSLIAAQMVGAEGRVTGVDMTQEMLAKARAAAAEMKATNVEFVEGEVEKLPFEAERRRRHLERRHRPRSGQGRRLLRDPSRPSPWRPHPASRRNDPEPGLRGRPTKDRPLDRLNCRRSAGGRVRTASRASRLRADRDRRPRGDLCQVSL
jgi:SAM-dependent methyltransferase